MIDAKMEFSVAQIACACNIIRDSNVIHARKRFLSVVVRGLYHLNNARGCTKSVTNDLCSRRDALNAHGVRQISALHDGASMSNLCEAHNN